MKTPVLQYQRQLKKALCCGYAAKKRLLGKFHQQLQLMLEDFPEPDYATLVQAFGSPEQAALELMRSLTDAERAVYRRNGLVVRFSAILSMVILLVLVVQVCLNMQNPFTTIDTYTYDGVVYTVPNFVENIWVSTFPVTRTQIVKHGDDTIATVAFDVAYILLDNKPIISAKLITQSDTEHGWNYTLESFTSTDNTVTLTYTLSKNLFWRRTFSLSLTRGEDDLLITS